MKREIKYLLFTFMTLFLTMTSVSAREMTLEELGKEVAQKEPDAEYVYVIGEYAFTSKHTLTAQDLMLAARSITGITDADGYTNATSIYGKMAVQKIERKSENFQYTGWKEPTTVLGETKLDLSSGKTVNIRYIDYKYYAEKSKATVDLTKTTETTYKNAFEGTLKITGGNNTLSEELSYDPATGKLTGLLLKYDNIDPSVFNGDDATGYYFGFVVEIPNATDATKVILKGNNRTKTIGYDSFDVQNVEGKSGLLVLCSVSPTSDDKIFEVSVDLDGDGTEYGATDYTLDLSGLTFQEDSKVSLTDKEDDISTEDKATLQDWGYTSFGDNKHYQLVSQEDGTYKLTGKVELQSMRAGGFSTEAQDGYFFVFNLKKPDDLVTVPEGVKVTVKGEKELTYGKEYFNEQGVFTEIFKLKDKCEGDTDCKIEITVDWDGEGKEYLESQTITINYKDLTFVKSSKFSVLDVADGGLAKNPLEETYGWKQPDHFDVQFKTEGTKVKVKGLLPILETFTESKDPFEGEDKTGYYLPFVIKTETAKKDTDNKTTVQFIHEGEESKTLTADNFDGNDVLYILRHLHKDAEDKTFTIIVDMDGEGEEYTPYTLTFDWSELTLQEKTIPQVSLNKASAKDKETFTKWGYKSEVNKELSLTNGELTGTLVEQVLLNGEAFGDDKKTGYYFDFTFTLPTGVSKDKVKIARLASANLTGSKKKEFQSSEYNDDGSLTVLFQIESDPNCKDNGDTCKVYYSVDYDGDGNNYLPALYTIDYSKVTFEKSSIFTVESIDKEVESQFPNTGWYNTEDGYSVSVTADETDSHKYKVSGVLPILEEGDWKDEEPFDSPNRLYYLGLGLKLINAPQDYNNDGNQKINIKFVHDTESTSYLKVFGDDFNSSHLLYILKALKTTNEDGSALADTDKWFTITVDLDGEDKEEYAPYTVTIDYSDLKFQDYSRGSVDYDVLKKADLTEESSAKTELTGYGFNVETVENVNIHTNTDQPDNHYKDGIEGKIKEQTLNGTTGFSNPTGYFVPMKISFPTDSNLTAYKNKWTITLYNESGKKMSAYKPKDEEYSQGWVLVLFKLNKDSETSKLKYEIDFDGEEDAFLPLEYTISYENLDYQTENKITFQYFDETTGKIETKEAKVYEDEVIPETLAPTFEGKNYAYHDFDYWYKTTGSAETPFVLGQEDSKTGENEDITLQAHYTLDVDKFLTDVISDLGSAETDYSSDFSSHFAISKTDTTITFDVKNPKSKLSILNDTSIPGAIAYILQRGEVKEITLSSDGKQVVFTKDGANNEVQPISLDETGTALKGKIQAGAKALFAEVLKDEGGEAEYTLNNMVLNDKNFSITIGDLDNSVQLANADKTVYEFNFDSDIVSVVDEETLKQALTKDYKTIYIEKSFEVEETIDINRAVDINSSDGTMLTSKTGNAIFKVSSTGVKIENLSLKAGENTKTLIDVESNGELTATKLKFVATDPDNKLDVAIDVKEGGKLTASNLTYEKETYEHPIVRTAKTGATVNLTDSGNGKASQVVKEKINFNAADSDTKETDSDYTYFNYYNDSKNAKIYTTVIYNYQGPYRKADTKYNYYGENLKVPTSPVFGTFEHYGETYTLIGFTKDTSQVLTGDNLPAGAVNKDALKVTEDAHYWAVFKVTLADGVKKVSDTEGFKGAINDPSVKAIYITDGNAVIDYGEEELKITNGVSIIGQPNSNTIIKAKKIVVADSAESVFINRVNLEIAAEKGQDSLIEVKGKKFALWQGALSNTGENAVDYQIYK